MTARLARIVRHPIKAVGHEEIGAARLTPGRVLPFDRHWAVAHRDAKFAGNPDGWAAKMNFLRGVSSGALMAVTAQLDEDRGELTLTHPQAGRITVIPGKDDADLLDWLRPLWPDSRPDPDRLVQVPGQAMTDVSAPYVSILSETSLVELGRHVGQDLSPHRFRGNLWVAGWEPFAETDMVGKRIRIGEAVVEIAQRITRCKATHMNPATGAEDCDTLGALQSCCGHQDFGLYGTIVTPGQITLADQVEVL
jgi:uncharacterized protein YcbX